MWPRSTSTLRHKQKTQHQQLPLGLKLVLKRLLTVHHTCCAHHLAIWISKEGLSQVDQHSIEKQKWLHRVPISDVNMSGVYAQESLFPMGSF